MIHYFIFNDKIFKWRHWLIVSALLFTQISLNQKLSSLEAQGLSVASFHSFKKDSGLMKILSFGHLPSVVDWLWIQALSGGGWYNAVQLRVRHSSILIWI